MLGKNYTNPEDRGRFGFSASGKYNAPYKMEHITIAVCIAAALTALGMIVFSVMRVVRDNPTGFSTGVALSAIAGAAAVVIVGIAVIAAALIIIKFVLQGFQCSYLADEEKFTATIGGTPHTIYYKDVQTVHFLPRMQRGAVRGYTVTIKINGACEEFGIVSNGYISESTTPFYIIKERVELIRAEEERVCSSAAAVRLSEDSAPKAKTDETHDAITRLETILGKDAEMPGISAKDAPLPEISERVSPTVNGYTDDMPAVGKDGRVIQSDRTYVGNDGRELGLNDIIAQGSFRVIVKTRTAVLIGIAALVVYAMLFIWVMGINNPLDMVTRTVFKLSISQLIMIILAPFYAGTIINFLRNGRQYNYKANGREFVITSKGIPDEHFFYKDVQSVTYKKMEFLWFIKGYKVEILTRFGITKYNFVFPGFGKLQPTRNLPFEVIRERIEHD